MIKSIDLKVGSKYVVVGENIKIGDVFDKVCKITNRDKITKITPNFILLMVAYYSEFLSFFNKKNHTSFFSGFMVFTKLSIHFLLSLFFVNIICLSYVLNQNMT